MSKSEVHSQSRQTARFQVRNLSGSKLSALMCAWRNMPSVSDCAQPRGRFLGLALLLPFAYQVVALLCLRRWGSASPWQHLDFFSGGFFALTMILLVYEIRFKRGILDSRETLREASGSTYDAATVRLGSMLALIDLLVFLDYGNWNLIPALRLRWLQMTGLALYGFAVAGVMWTDAYLARHFQEDSSNRQLMTVGPFAMVRHPRYASLLLAKLGFSLLFASVFGWIGLLALVVLIRRRIRLEESHLREIYGSGYGIYAGRTRRLLPGIY